VRKPVGQQAAQAFGSPPAPSFTADANVSRRDRRDLRACWRHLGALLTGTAQYTLERRRDKKNARSAALNLQLELWRGVESLGRPEYKLAERFGHGLGPEQALRDLLGAVAGHLTGQEWERYKKHGAYSTTTPRYHAFGQRSIEEGRLAVADGASALNRLAGNNAGDARVRSFMALS
jgi:hypothetical protein